MACSLPNMRHESYTLYNAAASGTGSAFPCRDFESKWVQVAEAAGGAITAVIKIQGTIDGTNWVETDSVTNASALFNVEQAFDQLRIVVSGWVAGTILVTFGGLNARTN